MISKFKRALRSLFPDVEGAARCNDAGAGLAEQGRIPEALREFKKAIEANPKLAEAWSNLGACYQHLDRPDQACNAYQSADTLGFHDARLFDNWGNALSVLGQLEEAEAKFRLALELDPGLIEAKANLGLCMTTMGMPDEGLRLTQEAWTFRPGDAALASMALFSSQYSTTLSPQQISVGHCRWPQAESIEPVQFANEPDPLRKLRIGYVSSDFRIHSCACFLLPLLRSHNTGRFSVFAYSSSPKSDEVTEKFRTTVDSWVDVSALRGQGFFNRIRADEIDILIDCTGHSKGNRLEEFQYRPAPIQVTWLGYPSTTGLKAMDFRISDAAADPVGLSEEFQSETLMRLPGGFHSYQPLTDVPDPSPAPRLKNQLFTFGAFHNLAKVSDDSIRLWAGALNATPNSRLMLKGRGLASAKIATNIKQRFVKAGLSEGRLLLADWHPFYGGHFQDYGLVDAILDSTPYNGTTTTCEALWMGVPVLTLRGDRTSARVGASLLTQAGYSQWIADTPQDFARLARDLADDPATLCEIRQTLRQTLRQTTLGDGALFASGFEMTLRGVWQDWCAKQP